jgi:histidinol-phosphate phosphatase family protein
VSIVGVIAWPELDSSVQKAAIVAGGKGTRIQALSGGVFPKALLPVAGCPIVFRQLELLARYGVREVAVLAGHLADTLAEAMRPEARRLGIKLELFVEPEPLGTAGCLLAARDFLADGDFFVLYGDVAVDMDLSRLAQFHCLRRALATIVAHANDHPHESDLLRTDNDGRVLEILPHESRPQGYYRNVVPAAVYCLSPEVFEAIQPRTKQDFIGDFFPRLLAGRPAVFAYMTPEYLRDMGTLDRFETVEQDLQSGLVERMHFSRPRPAVFFDRDGVLNVEIAGRGILRSEELELLPQAAEAVKKVNRRGWLAVVVTNQPQVARGMTTLDELDRIHARLETLLGRQGAYLDRIYYCPHHPDRGFAGEIAELKIDCLCRKPKPGLIGAALRDLPILLESSCLVGDTWRDMGAARALGIRAYGVRTGYGCQQCDDQYRPDRVFAHVGEAVDFALTSSRSKASSARG